MIILFLGMNISKPKVFRGGQGKNSPYQIIPYLPEYDCFFDSRHWVCASTDDVLPFAVTTRISANNQQFLKVYEKEERL